jgi:hypothetical protein
MRERGWQPQSRNAVPQFAPQSRPPMRVRHDSKGMGMTEQQQRTAGEREEIAARVANFKATQEKFAREREEFFAATLDNARRSSERPPAV